VVAIGKATGTDVREKGSAGRGVMSSRLLHFEPWPGEVFSCAARSSGTVEEVELRAHTPASKRPPNQGLLESAFQLDDHHLARGEKACELGFEPRRQFVEQ
jgi:hypothetical protein